MSEFAAWQVLIFVEHGNRARRTNDALRQSLHTRHTIGFRERLAEEYRPDRNQDVQPATNRRDQSAQCHDAEQRINSRIERLLERSTREVDVPMATRHTKATRERHEDREDQHPAGKQVWLYL